MLALFGTEHLDRVLAAYAEAASLPAGWRELIGLHQLHPVLVHAVSHGPSYGRHAAELAARRDGAGADLAQAQAQPALLDDQRAALAMREAEAQDRLSAARDALHAAEDAARATALAERDAERLASDAREARAAARNAHTRSARSAATNGRIGQAPSATKRAEASSMTRPVPPTIHSAGRAPSGGGGMSFRSSVVITPSTLPLPPGLR